MRSIVFRHWGWLAVGALGLAVLYASSGRRLLTGFSARPAVAEPVSGAANELNLPEDFARRVRQRSLLDDYAARFHVIDSAVEPQPVRPVPQPRQDRAAVRVLQPQVPEHILRYRQACGERVRPLRGFKAPILQDADDLRPVTLKEAELSAPSRQAAVHIQGRLAHDGLLPTLVRAVEILGPARLTTNAAAATRELRDLGFPIDLLRYFILADASGPGPENIVRWAAAELARGKSPDALAGTLRAARFQFSRTHPDFRSAEETGDHEIALVRLQVGGGYRNGIIPGGSIDVSGQLVAALPAADWLVTVPEEFLQPLGSMAAQSWRLRRAGALTLIPEKFSIAAWAQDNGKPGMLASLSEPPAHATLAPRYASQQEITSEFYPGESFLMDGLRAAGHKVVHSPLLFQGGNLLVAHDHRQGHRVLLLSETELYRNLGLGFTREQVIEAFKVEFAVDKCVVMPAVSYHLDYDVTLRVHQGQVLAFVNDAHAAALLIVQRGIAALERAGAIKPDDAALARLDLSREKYEALVKLVARVLQPFLNERGQYSAALARLFSAQPQDAPVQNLQCFFAAVDVLASTSITGTDANTDALTRGYFEALRTLSATAAAQREVLAGLGWQVVSVPSMPDLYRSLNYLNGLHDRAAYLMPAMGGFYAECDDAAANVFSSKLGDAVRIVRIMTAELQRGHGAVHCVAAAYPRLDDNHPGFTSATAVRSN